MHTIYTRILTAALCIGCAAAEAAFGQRVELKLATVAPEGSDWMNSLTAARSEILEATGGRVRLRLYPSGLMGSERDVLFKIRAGQLDGGGFMGVGISHICKDAEALMVPMLLRNYAEADTTLAALSPHLEAQSLANGFVAMGWTEVGFSYMFSTVPVRTLADLRASKPWATSEAGMLHDFFVAGRVNALPVPVGEVLTALQTGLLQTVFAPPLAAVAIGWHTRTRYRNDMELTYAFGGVFIAERSWRRLPAEDREQVRSIIDKHCRALNDTIRRSNQEAIDVLAAHGIRTLSPSPEERAEFEEVSRRSLETVVGRDFSREAWDQVQAVLREMRASSGPDS